MTGVSLLLGLELTANRIIQGNFELRDEIRGIVPHIRFHWMNTNEFYIFTKTLSSYQFWK